VRGTRGGGGVRGRMGEKEGGRGEGGCAWGAEEGEEEGQRR